MTPWSVKKLDLSPPSLSELVAPLTTTLSQNFKDISVSIEPCPDLTLSPFNLAAAGLSGNERVADIGGPPNLAPVPKRDRHYSIPEICSLMEMQSSHGFVLGASAGPFHVLGFNSELTPNYAYHDGEVTNRARYAKVDEKGECFTAPSPSTDFGLMGNLFGSDGLPGDVLKITARTRIGEMNFTETIQAALKSAFGDKLITLGGVFLIKVGKANLHVMPDFSKTPLKTRKEVEEWIRYYDMDAPLVCLSVLHSCEKQGWDLRAEHTHCFSEHGEGGHYHFDTTPESVEYEAYFNIARVLYRIDQPEREEGKS